MSVLPRGSTQIIIIMIIIIIKTQEQIDSNISLCEGNSPPSLTFMWEQQSAFMPAAVEHLAKSEVSQLKKFTICNNTKSLASVLSYSE